ncbi:MAG: DUF4157 domain-containing protein [Saprospiraceae bacterium]|nr:DUF4157 domain-containing protein [Saprospiraceae bacterium]
MTTPLMHRRQQREAGLVRPKQRNKNLTGLPYDLKLGMENLSGYDLDDVRVHYNSTYPARVNAEAYTQGLNIHIASGKETHLPHELGHVVQQIRGQVQANHSVRGVALNSDAILEDEATRLGNMAAKSLPGTDGRKSTNVLSRPPKNKSAIIQRKLYIEDESGTGKNFLRDCTVEQLEKLLYLIVSTINHYVFNSWEEARDYEIKDRTAEMHRASAENLEHCARFDFKSFDRFLINEAINLLKYRKDCDLDNENEGQRIPTFCNFVTELDAEDKKKGVIFKAPILSESDETDEDMNNTIINQNQIERNEVSGQTGPEGTSSISSQDVKLDIREEHGSEEGIRKDWIATMTAAYAKKYKSHISDEMNKLKEANEIEIARADDELKVTVKTETDTQDKKANLANIAKQTGHLCCIPFQAVSRGVGKLINTLNYCEGAIDTGQSIDDLLADLNFSTKESKVGLIKFIKNLHDAEEWTKQAIADARLERNGDVALVVYNGVSAIVTGAIENGTQETNMQHAAYFMGAQFIVGAVGLANNKEAGVLDKTSFCLRTAGNGAYFTSSEETKMAMQPGQTTESSNAHAEMAKYFMCAGALAHGANILVELLSCRFNRQSKESAAMEYLNTVKNIAKEVLTMTAKNRLRVMELQDSIVGLKNVIEKVHKKAEYSKKKIAKLKAKSNKKNDYLTTNEINHENNFY